MKRNNIYIKRAIFILLTGIFILGAGYTTIAQNCNQPEILYQQPDCYKAKDGPALSQGRECTPVTVCVNQQYTYTAGGGAWASYLWTITGPATPVINPNATSAIVNITWPLVGTYILTLTVTDGLGNTFTKCIEVTVKEKPVANFTFTPNNACTNSSVVFTSTTVYSGTPSYLWNFGDPSSPNNTALTAIATHQYNTAGTYTVTLIAYSTMLVPNSPTGQPGDSLTLVTCCADTIKKIVTVVKGNVTIECISTVCAGATSKYTAVGCGSPTWGTPVGGTIQSTSGNTVTILWGNGNPQGQLSVYCGTCTTYVSIPIVPLTPVIVGNTSPCNPGSSSYSVPYLPGTYYTWTLTNVTAGNTNVSNLLSTYPDNNTVWINWPNTTDTYQLTIVLNNKHLCCTSTASLTITPKVKFTVYGPSSICQYQSGTFTTSPTGTFNWAALPVTGVTPPSASAVATYTASFASTGNFVITATDLSSAFCNTTAAISTLVVPIPVPGIIQGPLTACAGSQYAYNMSTSAPAGYYYEWTITGGIFTPGPPTITTGDNVTVQWATLSGTITVVLKQTAAPNCNIPAGTITVVAATPGAVSGSLYVCVDGTGNYTLNGGNLPTGTIITWTISPASLGTIISGQGTNNITVLWHGQGGSGPWGPATISASTGCGPATPLPNIMIYPKFTFTISTTGLDVCQPAGMTLTANGAPLGTTFVWTPGGPGQTININAPGSYTVLGTGINGACSYSQTINIPDPFAIAPVTCGVGHCSVSNTTNEQLGVVVLKPASGIFTYEWHSGTCSSPGLLLATSTSGLLSDNYMALAPGNYCVIVYYGNCKRCVNFVVKKICCPDVNNPQITNKTQVTCDTYSFTGTTNPTSSTITWNFGDGVTAPGVSGVPISHTYANAGIYCVTFCVGPPSPNPTSCTGNCAVTQAVVPIAAGFSYKMGCNGCMDVTNLSAIFGNPAFVTYLWNFGDASTSTLQSPPQHCYALPGTYTVTLTVTYNDGAGIICTKTATQTVVYTKLDISISGPVCSGQPVTFTSTPGGFVTYLWNFGDGFTAYTSPMTHIYNAPGIYTVTLSVTDLLGNTCTATKKDTVLQGINSCTILPAFLCPGQPATLTAPAGPYTYLWEVQTLPNIFVAAPGANTGATYTTTVPGFYHVIVTNANGCTCISNTVEVKAVAKPKASFSISPSKNICSPGSLVTLTAPMITGYTYQWFANAIPVGGNSFMYMNFVSSTTIFTLILINQYGCKDTCIQTVTVNTPPAIPIITSTGNCEGVPITLTVTNYASNITWNNGATTISILVYTAGTYVATYTDPVTGCSSSAKYVINRRPSAGLFPHFCDSIPCNCIRPFVIYAPNPLIGIFASNYNISWYNGINNAFLGSGNSYNNGGLGAQTGSYYIIITDLTTGCKDTSNKYSIVVPKCDSCDCKESKWGDIVLTPGGNPVAGGNPTILKCNSNYVLDCNKPFSINATYLCKDSNCNGKVTYSLQPPVGLPLTGSLALNFTPNLNGVYILTLYGWCGGKKCDSCTIDLTVKCDTCDCKGSKWGDITLTKGIEKAGQLAGISARQSDPKSNENVGNNGLQKLKCKGTYKLDCNKPVTINANYLCKDSACNGTVTYSLQPPTGSPIPGNMALNFTPTLTGTYVLTMYGWCGNKLCDSCVIKFEVKCDTVNCCKGSHWGEITYDNGKGEQKISCGKEYVAKCKVPFTINANYICGKPDCIASVGYTFIPAAGSPLTGNILPPFTYTPILSGTYTLLLYGTCNGFICDTCKIIFKVDCPPDTVCCKYTITVKDPTVQLSTITNPNATVANSNFSITGPAGNLFTEIRAEVMSYNLFSNFNNECLNCKSYPYTWASIYKAGNVGAITPQITMFNSFVSSFNPAGNGMYQNPREVSWTSGNPFALPNNINIQFLLPPASIIDCCDLTAKICVKFTFRDAECRECEVIACFTVVIKPGGGGHNDDPQVCQCNIKPVISYEGNNNRPVSCGETVNLFPGIIPVNLNPGFDCKDQNGKDCAGSSVSVTIAKPDNTTQVLNGPNYSYTYNINLPGIYEYTITGTCGGKKCECKFKVNNPNK